MIQFIKNGQIGHLALGQCFKQVKTGRGQRTIKVNYLQLIDANGNVLDENQFGARLSVPKIIVELESLGWDIINNEQSQQQEEVA